MTLKKPVLFFCLLLCHLICAQRDSIVLNEVVISDSQVRNFTNSQSVLTLNDSVVKNNGQSLTSLLAYNTVIYFKENGPGMVSSPSFRGTTAQQTAVIWNGINVNSQFNGQTDFNTINPANFDSVSVRAGGGSSIYGSSAIGGSIHLENELGFGNKFENSFHSEYGSYNTKAINYGLKASNGNFTSAFAISHASSDNDFEFPSGKRKNTNGQYENTAITTSIAYRLNAANILTFHNYIFDGSRHFSLLFPTDTKTRYVDFNTRSLIEWSSSYRYFKSKAKAAFLKEEYRFYENIATEQHYYGVAETAVFKYDAAYQRTKKLLINGVGDIQLANGRGSDISSNERTTSSAAILLRYKIFRNFTCEAGLRGEFSNRYQSPLLFSAGSRWDVTDQYSLKANISRNFRAPTFNDLFWQDGGNRDLKPELAMQYEIGNEFKYKGFKLSLTGYLNKISDMIQWLPGTTSSWMPKNINDVTSYGIESMLEWKGKSGGHRFEAHSTYAYTISENDTTGYQLIYVPYHKATGSAAYSYGNISMYGQLLFTGETFTRSDNNPMYNIDSYAVANAGAEYVFGKKDFLKIGVRVKNIFDEEYEVVERRPFPGRNYSMYLTLIIK